LRGFGICLEFIHHVLCRREEQVCQALARRFTGARGRSCPAARSCSRTSGNVPAPTYYKSAKRAEIVDLDRKTYLDMSYCRIGTTKLGYTDPDVNAAVETAIR
jgi:4-aminobutyrate aminotransferase-like enzyme